MKHTALTKCINSINNTHQSTAFHIININRQPNLELPRQATLELQSVRSKLTVGENRPDNSYFLVISFQKMTQRCFSDQTHFYLINASLKID